jgi:hypothetical protein
MPATQAQSGFKAKIFTDDGSGTFAIQIAETMDIDGPEITQLLDDATNTDSPGGAAEKISVGIHEVGPVTFTCNFLQDDSSQNLMVTRVKSGSLDNYRLVFKSGTKRWAFKAFVEKVGASYPNKSKAVRPVTLQISGTSVVEAHP